MPPPRDNLPKPWRRTPLIHSTTLSKSAGCQIYLKLENLQPSGSFKSRGIGNLLLSHLSSLSSPTDREKIHFYSSSGGNAGLACVCAAVSLGSPATIVVPLSTTAFMIEKIREAGAAEIVQEGTSWYEADAYMREVVIPEAERRGEKPVYVPPFDAQEIWDGHATMVPEVLEDLGQAPDVVVCSVGGGGLFTGLMLGREQAKEKGEGIKVLAVETEGADSLALSLKEGKLSTLPAITSIATTLGARTVAKQAYEYAKSDAVKSVVLKDREAMEGCVRFADDERIMVEASCGVSLALCYGRKLRQVMPELTEASKVVIVVCGGKNVTTNMLQTWNEQLKQPA
ncbi:tryptophan synthase beta subunit-like PLP-dependent enzyme [Macroventuria anomochaeta]|uniref:Tryptophan synthase beta subunit-like PLP-dependent enzyme n=1 Tax=Macroventuria anomochaeta TaxID=301207 RepID=A0ACB6RYZ0_9PLEO|nr:tryptophan synthase beta subunit-like PLP-dependent enzyme [Macroventuria anomochaeta]KAF2626092.1 tryptophan synthase beta subunit-like PLP-dependent enzyme [Macroventuria anomochaeta]